MRKEKINKNNNQTGNIKYHEISIINPETDIPAVIHHPVRRPMKNRVL